MTQDLPMGRESDKTFITNVANEIQGTLRPTENNYEDPETMKWQRRSEIPVPTT
jgi:hypothetical protein